MSAVGIYRTRCCGLLELSGLCEFTTARGAMQSIAWAFNRQHLDRVPFIMFTGVVTNNEKDNQQINHAGSRRVDNYGQAFADYIVKNGLGSVTSSSTKRNWSGNDIRVWIWELNWDRVEPFMLKLEQVNAN